MDDILVEFKKGLEIAMSNLKAQEFEKTLVAAKAINEAVCADTCVLDGLDAEQYALAQAAAAISWLEI